MTLKRILTCLLLIFILQSKLFSQIEWQSNYDADSTCFIGKTSFQSWVGYLAQYTTLGYSPAVAPTGTFRGLCIFINIIYDQTPSLDPCTNPNDVWPAATIEGVNNQAIPGFLDDFIDVYYNPTGSTGIMTRLYDESSFGSLIVLGDHMIVNIKQSTITPSSPGASFTQATLINKVLDLINSNGGLNTLNSHNTIADFDSNSDGNIDYIQFICRNIVKTTTYYY